MNKDHCECCPPASAEEALEILNNGLEIAAGYPDPKGFALVLGGTLAGLAGRGAIDEHYAIRANHFLALLCRQAGHGWIGDGEEDSDATDA